MQPLHSILAFAAADLGCHAVKERRHLMSWPRGRTAFSFVAALLSTWFFVGFARAQSVPAASNSNESARIILQRYADAWRGQRELAFDSVLALAFWVYGDQGGEFSLTLTQAAGGIMMSRPRMTSGSNSTWSF